MGEAEPGAPRLLVPANGAVEDPAAFAARAEIARIKASVTEKPTWAAKVWDGEIVARWRQEFRKQAEPAAEEDDDDGPAEPPLGVQEPAAPLFDQAIAELRAARYFHRFGIAYDDGLVPAPLLAALQDQLRALATFAHPGSRGTVQDLIHPSLYPYVAGRSFAPGRARRRAYPVPQPPLERRPAWEGSDLDRFAHCVLGDEEQSATQWLPAEVDVDAAGAARFVSYINNLPRAAHAALYDTLGQVVSLMLPLFEDVVTGPNAPSRVSLRGRRLQVIVKAANYVLEPEKTYEGSWHVEGMLHERIVATGIYYYDQRGAIGANGIRFRRLRNRNIIGHSIMRVTQDLGGDSYGGRLARVEQCTEDAPFVTHPDKTGEEITGPEGDDRSDGSDGGDFEFDSVPTGFTGPRYCLHDDDTAAEQCSADYVWSVGYKRQEVRNFVDLDAIPTPAGRVLVFKNSLLHQVQRLYNAGSDRAERRILVFWLVHPDYPIVSTADVPPQQWELLAPALAVLLALRLGRNPRLAWLVLGFARWGFRAAEADAVMQELMRDRAAAGSSLAANFTSNITREYSFCEH